MLPHSLNDISKLNTLYKTAEQTKVKLAFDIFEKYEWTLAEIIEFILKNHKTETFDDRIKAIGSRRFYLGSLFVNFNVIEDWEALDDTTYYSLELNLVLKD